MSHHEEPHKDGSGANAIKMVHTDSKWTIGLDVTRLIFSISLLLFSAVSVIYAIIVNGTTMPFPAWAQFLCLTIALFVLGVLEGLQIAVVELAHNDPSQYEAVYPRAAKLLAFENSGRNVERFLMGRQVLVVFTVFVAARITTFDLFWGDVPQEMIHAVMFSGFLGVVLVVIVAQLTPQVLASAYPVEFLNLPGMPIAFWACLIVEASGIAHAVWFLCVTVRKMFYSCLCEKHGTETAEIMQRVKSKSSVAMTPRDFDEEVNITVTNDMLEVAEKAEEDIEEEVEMAKQRKQSKDLSARYTAVFHADHDDDHMDNEMNALIQNVGNSRELFYIYGDNKYLSPAQCYDKFKNSGLNPPHFLLPPDDKDHIPPHIVAMTLLKMYTGQQPHNKDE